MTNTKTWSNLPREILNLVVNYCGRNTEEVKWMFVNKNWFDFYLSQTYNIIFIDLKTDDKKVDKILFSNFNVGRWVKTITFKTVQLPNDMDKLDLTSDCLSMLMKNTPNVEEVQFELAENLNNMIWTYFSTVLMNTSYWKLRILPEAGRDNLSYSAYYYLCAYHSRATLKKLYLSFGMVGSLDFSCLEEFKALETLEVDNNVINNMDDLYLLLQYTPNLKEATIKFASNHFEMPQDESSGQEYQVYSNLKKLTLINFTPKLNKDLLAFTDQLSKVDHLEIIGEVNEQWPASEIPSSVTDIFFDAIDSLSEYKITVPGGAEGADFARKWLKSKIESKKEIHLSILYVNQSEIEPDVSVTVKSSKSSSAPVLQYQISHSDTNSAEGVNVITNISNNVSQVVIDGLASDSARTEALLRTIVAKERHCLKTLIIKNSSIKSYTSPNYTITVLQHIKRITFLNCVIDLTPLKVFLKEFEHLDYLRFDGCKFEGDPNNNWIVDTPNTTLGTVYFSNFRKVVASHQYLQNLKNVILININYIVPNYKRFYIIIEDTLTEMTEELFHMFNTKLDNNEKALILIQTKCTKELVFKLTNSSKEVKVPFPKFY